MILVQLFVPKTSTPWRKWIKKKWHIRKFLGLANKHGHTDRIPWILSEIYSSRKEVIICPKQIQQIFYHVVYYFFKNEKGIENKNWRRKILRTFKNFKTYCSEIASILSNNMQNSYQKYEYI